MIAVTAEVQAILDSGAAWYADLYTFTLLSGTVVRVTSGDRSVGWGGETWLSPNDADVPLIERGDITFEAGLTVDQLTLTIHAGLEMTVSGLPWPHALRAGLFDGAEVELMRAVGALGDPAAGVIPRFTGKVGPCNPGRLTSTITVDSLLAYLRAPVPRNVYQPSCANTIYDVACGLNRASREVAVTVTGISADGLLLAVTGSHVASAYVAGFARFTGVGANVAQEVTINDNTASSITLLYPFPASLVVGDTLSLAPGCTKSRAACAVYGNVVRFRGHPHVPVPETML